MATMQNAPMLVNQLLAGKAKLCGTIDNADESGEAFVVSFRVIDKCGDEEYYAGIYTLDGKPVAKKCRRIPLDFDILKGLYDVLYLLAAFASPTKDVRFTIAAPGNSKQAYRVTYVCCDKSLASTGKVRKIFTD